MDGSVYMQGHDASTLASHRSRSAEKQASYLLPKITRTSHILDVGCGPGTITCDFAKYTSQGHATGVDYSADVIESAETEAKNRGVQNITFRAATVHNLPFDDETFDIVHCNAVLVHLPRAVEALKEMRRVCKTGGIVATREPDWATCIIHPYMPPLERWKAVHVQLKRNEGIEPNAGRHLASWALEAGFSTGNVSIQCDVLQYFGKEEVKWWGELYAKRMHTEMGDRAVRASIATANEVDVFAAAYLEWSTTDGALWTLTHMMMLCEK
jgi:ubiquinone/menaquinone biosynthesis C-methylase UbiE